MNKSLLFILATGAIIALSAVANPQKTRQGLRKGGCCC